MVGCISGAPPRQISWEWVQANLVVEVAEEAVDAVRHLRDGVALEQELVDS